ncbi:amidase family protein [Streptomyces atratus]|uniref:amidase family protein n=1 Tax=Streptomyces atratus TaxID=1893 RepID=UPI0009A0EC0B|nr:amidase family protein [Streptomyces atratus]
MPSTQHLWDPTRGPGGSSGGSAAALAAGLTGLELGGDSAGSIRVPAHFCGVYGLRPSFGIVPRYGSVSGHAPGTLADFDMAVLGPLGRHADDLDRGLDVLAGADHDRAPAWRLELPPARSSTLREFRVAAWLDDPFCPVDSELVAIMKTTLEAVRAEGAVVVEGKGPVGLAVSAVADGAERAGRAGRVVCRACGARRGGRGRGRVRVGPDAPLP